MPSRMALESKGLAAASDIGASSLSGNIQQCHALAPAGASIGRSGKKDLKSALVGAFARGDLLDQFDDAAAHLGVGDAGEGAGQRQAFGGREKIRNIGGRTAFADAVGVDRAARAAIEQK